MTKAMDTWAISRGNARLVSDVAAATAAHFCFTQACAVQQAFVYQGYSRQGVKRLPTRESGNCGSGVNIQ